MGRLKSTDAIEIAEGVFVPAVKGLLVNGVLLGEPVELDGDPKTYEWDDSALPNGTIDAEGNITDDEGNLIMTAEQPVVDELVVEELPIEEAPAEEEAPSEELPVEEKPVAEEEPELVEEV